MTVAPVVYIHHFHFTTSGLARKAAYLIKCGKLKFKLSGNDLYFYDKVAHDNMLLKFNSKFKNSFTVI